VLTVEQLLASAGVAKESTTGDRGKAKITEASTKLRRLQDAIKAGVNPAALVDAINEAQVELESAEAERALQPEARTITHAEVDLRLEIFYHSDQKAAEVAIRLGRDSECVRGASCSLTTRLSLLPRVATCVTR